jgi:hypothetical protein
MKTLKELLHLTYNEDGKYIVSWRRPDFQVEDESQSEEISKDDFEKIGEIINLQNRKIVVYKDGSYHYLKDGLTWEFENDEDYLCTISLGGLKDYDELNHPINKKAQEIPQLKGTLEQLDNLMDGIKKN